MSIFESIVSRTQVEVKVRELLQEWLPTYLSEVEEQTPGWDPSLHLPAPRSFTSSNEFHKWPDDQLPCIVVICPGLNGRPTREGRGKYRANFAVGIAAVVSASEHAMTRQIADMYAAAIRTCLIQRPSIGGLATGLMWEDETTSDIPTSRSKSIAAGKVIFSVEVDGVAYAQAGPASPAEPTDDPHAIPQPEWPEVESTNVEITRIEEG